MLDTKPAPAGFPIWGSILDDVWTIEEEQYADQPAEELHGAHMMEMLEGVWADVGLPVNKAKNVSGAKCAEVQGALVAGIQQTVGVSVPKLTELLEAGLFVVSSPVPLVRTVARLVGKLSYAVCFQVLGRSWFEEVYQWLERCRSTGLRRAHLPHQVV